jgi:pimeloyl-ACP methyl ester carboxylesterase
MQQESLYIDGDDYQLHLRHISKNPAGVPVLMIHGSIENGLIFYTEKGKGLACYLAEHGYDVYVADLRGRGKSTPSISANSHFGQSELITQDIPLMIDFISNKTNQAMHLVAHSWGGVLVASCLARFPQYLSKVLSNTCFGSKRVITVKSIEKFFKMDLVWAFVSVKLANKHGFLDAKKYRIGSDNETKKSLQQSIAWVTLGDWVDPHDGFDYQQASTQLTWPPSWHLTGINDKVLGHPQDVKRFIAESANSQAKFSLLAKQHGNALDYDHINILTHPQAVHDHFPQLVQWLKSINK